MREKRQFLVWYLVKFGDVAAVLPAHLRQPNVGALGDQHSGGHPGRVRRELFIFVELIAENWHFRAGDNPVLLPSTALGGSAGRVELHPDGQLFLVQNLAGNQQQLLQAIAQQRLPELTDKGKLIGQRARRAHGRCAQQLQQVHRLGVRQGNQRTRGEIVRQLLRDLAVNGLCGESFFFEELPERLKRLIAVGCPQQQQLFQRSGAMRSFTASLLQPLARRFNAADDRNAGKLHDKGEKHCVQSIRAHLRGKKLQRVGHYRGIELLSVSRHQDMAGLVDQPHGIKLAGMNRLLGMLFNVANLVDAMRKLAAGGHIGENHVPCVGKQRLREAVPFTRLPSYMEFHHRKPYSKYAAGWPRSRF